MNLKCAWHSKMRFSAEAGQHRIEMDTKQPIGEDEAPSPKQLLLAAICGCTAMDVVALLRKYKQALKSFSISAEATPTEGKPPIIFQSVDLLFQVDGEIDKEKLLEAVRLSQTQYCGVGAMVSKSVPIRYKVLLNGIFLGEGEAKF